MTADYKKQNQEILSSGYKGSKATLNARQGFQEVYLECELFLDTHGLNSFRLTNPFDTDSGPVQPGTTDKGAAGGFGTPVKPEDSFLQDPSGFKKQDRLSVDIPDILPLERADDSEYTLKSHRTKSRPGSDLQPQQRSGEIQAAPGDSFPFKRFLPEQPASELDEPLAVPKDPVSERDILYFNSTVKSADQKWLIHGESNAKSSEPDIGKNYSFRAREKDFLHHDPFYAEMTGFSTDTLEMYKASVKGDPVGFHLLGKEFSPLKIDGFREKGGKVEAGKNYVVGEKGPELLVMPSSSGMVLPSDRVTNQQSVSVIFENINISTGPGQTRESVIIQIKEALNELAETEFRAQTGIMKN